MKIILSTAIGLLFCLSISYAQVSESKNWCRLNCEYTDEDKVNSELLFLRMNNDSIKNKLLNDQVKQIPIRIGIIQSDSLQSSISEIVIRKTIFDLNESFQDANFKFYLDRIDLIVSEIKLEDLSNNQYFLYDTFSKEHDLENMLSIYILDHKHEFCTITGNSISCGRTGGFSYILSGKANNVVISRFDLEDPKVVAHELGHFFGLYHTFEEHFFGRDTMNVSDCHLAGDRICDTPPDPGTIFEVYVNYSKCEMIGFKDEKGNEFKPILENIMSYYKPCYLRRYSFTPQQIEVMQLAFDLDIRKNLLR